MAQAGVAFLMASLLFQDSSRRRPLHQAQPSAPSVQQPEALVSADSCPCTPRALFSFLSFALVILLLPDCCSSGRSDEVRGDTSTLTLMRAGPWRAQMELPGKDGAPSFANKEPVFAAHPGGDCARRQHRICRRPQQEQIRPQLPRRRRATPASTRSCRRSLRRTWRSARRQAPSTRSPSS